MKQIITLTFLCLLSFVGWSQQKEVLEVPSGNLQDVNLSSFEAFRDAPGNPLQEYVRTYRHEDLPKEFTGSYYNEEEFTPGLIEVDGKEQKLNVFLRYNAVQDEVELKLKKEEDTVYVLPKFENLVYRTKDYSYRYGNRKEEDGKSRPGYIIYFFEGENLLFISHPMAHIQKEVKPKSGYDKYKPAHYSVRHFYFLEKPDGSVIEVNLREKDFRKLLSNSSTMKEYFADHKIRSVEDVVAMLQFYEEQRKSS